MALLFAGARVLSSIGTALSVESTVSGVLGVPDVQAALLRFAVKLAFKTKKVDADAAAEMVDLMRSRVPRDTGRLYNGIEAHQEDDGTWLVEASAVHPRGSKESADYARFVEFGTAPGTRGDRTSYVADEGFFSTDALGDGRFRGRARARTRKVYRTHAGTPAQPYFFESAREVLEKRGISMQSILDQADNDFQEAA